MTLPCLSVANEALENINLYEYQRDAIESNLQAMTGKYVDEPVSSRDDVVIKQKHRPKSKQELEVLLGTWMLSHKEGGVTYTRSSSFKIIYLLTLTKSP